MSKLKNLPTSAPQNFATLLTSKPHQIISMALSESTLFQMSIFTFADKETISEEAYFGDTMYLILEGMTHIILNGHAHLLKQGDVFKVPAHTLHAIGGVGPFKVFQITLNEEETL